MPYIISITFVARYRPNFDTWPPKAEMIPRLTEYNAANGFQDFGMPFYMFSRGLKLPGLPVPEKAIADRPADKPLKTLPDAINTPIHILVSAKLMRLMDEADPGIHQFIPIDVFRSKSETDAEIYYILIVGQVIDNLVDQVRSTAKFKEYGNSAVYSTPRSDNDPTLILNSTSCANKGIWRSSQIGDQIMISDELHQAMRDQKITGLDYLRVRAH